MRIGETSRTSGGILWMTGCPSAGKSTLARRVAAELTKAGRAGEVLDGDEVRTHLSSGLGFSREDRDINVGRLALVARLLAKHGVLAIVAAVSPYAQARADARRQAEQLGIRFVEVFVDAPIDVLVERDVKGLYRKALAGEIGHFTGVSDPYERPAHPDVLIRSDQQDIDACVTRILEAVGQAEPKV
jgi:adenylyl-sulfate kinase